MLPAKEEPLCCLGPGLTREEGGTIELVRKNYWDAVI